MTWMIRVNSKARTVYLPSKSNNEFFLIHGYTGSPTDFKDLGKELHKRFDACVKIIRLPGHGRSIEALDKLSYDDFYNFVKDELKKDIEKGKNIVLVGHSFGALLALDLASNFSVKGLVIQSVPYRLKFPFNLRILRLFTFLKKTWKKRLDEEERRLRGKAFFYDRMHRNWLKISKVANRKSINALFMIKAPALIIHSKNERLVNVEGAFKIYENIKSNIKKLKIFDNKYHNPLFSDSEEDVTNEIIQFIKENDVFKKKKSFIEKIKNNVKKEFDRFN